MLSCTTYNFWFGEDARLQVDLNILRCRLSSNKRPAGSREQQSCQSQPAHGAWILTRKTLFRRHGTLLYLSTTPPTRDWEAEEQEVDVASGQQRTNKNRESETLWPHFVRGLSVAVRYRYRYCIHTGKICISTFSIKNLRTSCCDFTV